MEFHGPIFIVGVGRSGTKLIRSILDNHSKISLPDIESQFIPNFLNHFRKKQIAKNELFKYFLNTTFFIRKSEDFKLCKNLELELKEITEPTLFIENVLKIYSSKYQLNEDFNFIWGDKTPFYIRDVSVLLEFFPNAKIIHIYRDPRDVALSYSKTWGKNLFSSAEKWREMIAYINSQKEKIKQSIYELSYEDLTSNTGEELQNLCDFIGIDFELEMTTLKKRTEFFGSTQSTSDIIQSNSNKFISKLSTIQIKRIEEITKPELLNQGYTLTNNVSFKPMKKFCKSFFKLIDALKLYKHLVFKQNGFFAGTKIFLSGVLKN